MEKLYIVIPAYNEEETIEKVVQEWYPIVEKQNDESRLVVVNDGSKDTTLLKCRILMEKMPLLDVVDKPNSGHGASVLLAYHYALDSGADYIFQTDSDGQTCPEEFQYFWEHRKEHGAIIGNRRHRQDGVSRIIVTKILKLTIRVIYGLDIADANAPFRLMNRNLLEKYLYDIPENFNLPNIMLTVFFLYNKEDVLFVPITFRPRQGGVNSLNIPRIIKIGVRAVKDFKVIKKEMERKEICKNLN